MMGEGFEIVQDRQERLHYRHRGGETLCRIDEPVAPARPGFWPVCEDCALIAGVRLLPIR